MADAEELHETGGLIAAGQLADGTAIASPLARFIRTGDECPNRRVASGAVVTLDSTDLRVIADASGQFSFESVLPGPYTIRVRDSVAVSPVTVDSIGGIVPDSSIQQVVRRIATMPVEARLGRVDPAGEGGGFFMCGIPAGIPLRTHITTQAGAEHDGTTTVSRVDYDDQGRRREGTLRAIKLVVSPP